MAACARVPFLGEAFDTACAAGVAHPCHSNHPCYHWSVELELNVPGPVEGLELARELAQAQALAQMWRMAA